MRGISNRARRAPRRPGSAHGFFEGPVARRRASPPTRRIQCHRIDCCTWGDPRPRRFAFGVGRGRRLNAQMLPATPGQDAPVTLELAAPPAGSYWRRRAALPRPAGVITSSWTRAGPVTSGACTRCASLDLGGFSVCIGSDQAGLWQGRPFGDGYWNPLGDELADGVHVIGLRHRAAAGDRPARAPHAEFRRGAHRAHRHRHRRRAAGLQRRLRLDLVHALHPAPASPRCGAWRATATSPTWSTR